MSQYCRSCGAAVESGDVNCGGCGASIAPVVRSQIIVVLLVVVVLAIVLFVRMGMHRI
jgi:hypothetical protein